MKNSNLINATLLLSTPQCGIVKLEVPSLPNAEIIVQASGLSLCGKHRNTLYLSTTVNDSEHSALYSSSESAISHQGECLSAFVLSKEFQFNVLTPFVEAFFENRMISTSATRLS